MLRAASPPARRPSRPRKLRQALAWLLLGALVPLLLGSTILLWRQWDLQREASTNRLKDLALALQLSLDRELALDQTTLQVLATSVAIDTRDWAAFHATATELTSSHLASWVMLGNASGQMLINTFVQFGTPLPSILPDDATHKQQIDWEGRSLPGQDTTVLSEPFRTGLPRVSDLYYSPVLKGPVVGLSVPVKRSGEVLYTLAFGYTPASFAAFLQRQADSETVLMGIVDGNGRIIARNRDPEITIARMAPPPLDQGRQSARTGISDTVTLEGTAAFLAYRRSDLTDWSIFVASPRAKVLAPVRHSLLLWIALLFVMVLVTVILAHRLWRRVALPLTELARQARELGERNIDMPPTDIDEVETLRKALQEAAETECARRDEVVRRLAVEERERLVASSHADELRAADRRKDEFLAMLGHELRNPLAPISNALAVMRKLAPGDPALPRLQDMMERQTRQLSHLVDDLLDVSRINTGKIALRKQRLDLNMVIRQAAQVAQDAMNRRSHTFTVTPSAAPLWACGDEARLSQIFGNLLDNAAKYTEPGGKVELTVRDEAGSAVVRISDTGPGIRPELLPHVFDLFWQADWSHTRTEGGLGVGLHVVKRLVEKHGGEVRVESDGVRGTTFEVRLPLAAATELPEPREQPQEVARALQLLVVDDNKDAAESLAMLLRLDGHTVRTAYGGLEALEYAKAAPPDAVLLDIGMPGMDGYELVRRLKREPLVCDAAMIAVTGYGVWPDSVETERSGIDYLLTKPVERKQVQQILARVISRAHTQ